MGSRGGCGHVAPGAWVTWGVVALLAVAGGCAASRRANVGGDGGPACAAGCLVDDACVDVGERPPGSPCTVCDDTDGGAALVALDGVVCDDGDPCTVGETCAGRSCVGRPRRCGGDAVCVPERGGCVVDCPGGCAIDLRCVAPGTTDPERPCRRCDPSRDPEGWSDADGATCDDGSRCTVDDTCHGGSCAGTPVPCDDGIACNGLERCDPGTGECTPGPSPCAAGEVCDVEGDACVCAEARVVCGGACVDTSSDVDHCGGCNEPCDGHCVDGACSGSLTPGSTAVAALFGWSVRCLAWDGDLCQHVQVRLGCGTCPLHERCEEWHDLTTYNLAHVRAAPVVCEIATGNREVVRVTAEDEAEAPRACGWASREHPECSDTKGSLSREGVVGLSGGLLVDESFCRRPGFPADMGPTGSSVRLGVECVGW